MKITCNSSIWLTEVRAREMLARHGLELTRATFYTYISRGLFSHVRTKTHPHNSHKTLYHRGDLLEAAQGNPGSAALRQAREIARQADESGEWMSFKDLHKAVKEVHPGLKTKGSIDNFLYREKGIKIRTLFPGNKHNGYSLQGRNCQRYLTADVEQAAVKWRDIAAHSAEIRSNRVTCEEPPGATWEKITSVYPMGSNPYGRVCNAIRHGKLQAVFVKGCRYIDVVQAAEYLNWRTIAKLREYWDSEKIKARIAWQEENGLSSPWYRDACSTSTVYAPEQAHL